MTVDLDTRPLLSSLGLGALGTFFGVYLLSPVVAGAAMALSSLSVVTNALRLKRWQAPVNPEVVAGPKSV